MEISKKKGFSPSPSKDANQNKLKRRKRVESNNYWLWIVAGGEFMCLPVSLIMQVIMCIVPVGLAVAVMHR